MNGDKYLKTINNPIKFFGFMLFRLPSLLFWGIRVKNMDNDHCQIHIPFNWRTKNPFKSIYFAALSGAAELSTGLLVQKNVFENGTFSMLVVESIANFHKKADTDIVFSCDQGREVNAFFATLDKPNASGTLLLTSVGRNKNNQIVAEFKFKWSLKRKS